MSIAEVSYERQRRYQGPRHLRQSAQRLVQYGGVAHRDRAEAARDDDNVEIVHGNPIGNERLIKLLGTLACRPLRLKRGKNASNLVAIHAIAARVGACIRGVLDATVRNYFTDYLSQLADAR